MKNKMLTKDLVQIAITVALMVVFTLFVSIPLGPVPLTFQTIICVASGILLGSKKAQSQWLFTFFSALSAIYLCFRVLRVGSLRFLNQVSVTL